MADWNSIDFARLGKVLLIKAMAVVRDASRSFDGGVSAEDLVKETLNAFLDSSNGLGWSEQKGRRRLSFVACSLTRRGRTSAARKR